ncbi:hypothetical protein [Segatella sp.]
MKKEKDFSETDFSKKALESLSDDEILQGFKDADAENDVFENVLRESGCR